MDDRLVAVGRRRRQLHARRRRRTSRPSSPGQEVPARLVGLEPLRRTASAPPACRARVDAERHELHVLRRHGVLKLGHLLRHHRARRRGSCVKMNAATHDLPLSCSESNGLPSWSISANGGDVEQHRQAVARRRRVAADLHALGGGPSSPRATCRARPRRPSSARGRPTARRDDLLVRYSSGSSISPLLERHSRSPAVVRRDQRWPAANITAREGDADAAGTADEPRPQVVAPRSSQYIARRSPARP